KSVRFRGQEVLDAVELRERSQARRKMSKRKWLALGRRAALPGEQDCNARRVDRLDTSEIDDAGRRERRFGADGEHRRSGIHGERTGGHPTLALHLKRGGDFAHLAGGGGGAGPLFFVSS